MLYVTKINHRLSITKFISNDRVHLLMTNFFDRNKSGLSKIDDFERLERWLSDVDVEQQFLNYAAKVENLKPAAGEWEKTRWYMLPQVKALVGRYSKLQDEAFYRFYLPIDNEFQRALTEQ